MDRQQKINVLLAVQAGAPVELALKTVSQHQIIAEKRKGDPRLYYNGRALTQPEIDCFNGPYVLYNITYDDVPEPSNTTRYLLTKTKV